MAKKYKFVRMPVKTYKRYVEIQQEMKKDITKITGKEPKLPMTKVFNAVVSKDINENYIQIDKKNLLKMSKKKRRIW